MAFLNATISSVYIKQISNLCRQNEIELILIEMAGFRNTRNNDSIGPYELFNDQIPHVNLYNFNGPGIDSILDPNIDWLGGSHLNETGARKFTEYISPFLLK